MTADLDGNVLAGAMSELFAIDITSATAQCASCGVTGPVAQARVYADAPGLTARCPACGQVVLRLVRAPDRAWLDLRGITFLEAQMAGQ
ncbi:MAG TPA: DUF6510 family protein [Streptosporangiaceae bacterium]|jgi:hypothetical protein